MKHKFVCDMCFPDATEYGELTSGYWLASQDDKYFIIGANGHDKDVVVYFNEKPTTNPDSDDNASEEYMQAWYDLAISYKLSLPPIETYLFIHSCVASGYTTEKMLMSWIYDRAGLLMEYYEENKTASTTVSNESRWEYRVVIENFKLEDASGCKENKIYSIREVCFNGGKAISCEDESVVCGPSLVDLRLTLGNLGDALKKPVLFKSDLNKVEEEEEEVELNDSIYMID